jgi:hypothetical protein
VGRGVWLLLNGLPRDASACSQFALRELQIIFGKRQAIITGFWVERLVGAIYLLPCPLGITLRHDGVMSGRLSHSTCRQSQTSQKAMPATSTPLAPMIAKSCVNMAARKNSARPTTWRGAEASILDNCRPRVQMRPSNFLRNLQFAPSRYVSTAGRYCRSPVSGHCNPIDWVFLQFSAAATLNGPACRRQSGCYRSTVTWK